MYSLESPHRGDSNESTQYTIVNIIKKITPNFSQYMIMSAAGLEKSSVLPVLDRFLKLKTDLFLDKKLKNRSIKLYFSRFCNTQTDIVTYQNCSHLIIRCYLS